MRKLMLLLLVVATISMHAMQKEESRKQLTIIDLDCLSKEKFMEMTDEQKWELHEGSRELVRRYLKVVHDKNERMARVQSVLEITMAELETNINHLQLKLEKKNSAL